MSPLPESCKRLINDHFISFKTAKPNETPCCSSSVCLFASPQRSARAAAEESDAVFTELIRSIELKRFEVRELIKAQEKTAVGHAEQQLVEIQKEISELKMNEAELDKLSRTEDHVHFLQVTPLTFFRFQQQHGPNAAQTVGPSWFVTLELSVSPCSTRAVSFAFSHHRPQTHLWPGDDGCVGF